MIAISLLEFWLVGRRDAVLPEGQRCEGASGRRCARAQRAEGGASPGTGPSGSQEEPSLHLPRGWGISLLQRRKVSLQKQNF